MRAERIRNRYVGRDSLQTISHDVLGVLGHVMMRSEADARSGKDRMRLEFVLISTSTENFISRRLRTSEKGEDAGTAGPDPTHLIVLTKLWSPTAGSDCLCRLDVVGMSKSVRR